MELARKGGKTYVRINDYEALRKLFGQLLGEVQRIKSEGVTTRPATNPFDTDLRCKNRPQASQGSDRTLLKKLDIPPYRGFINPVYTPVTDARGEITDIRISYP